MDMRISRQIPVQQPRPESRALSAAQQTAAAAPQRAGAGGQQAAVSDSDRLRAFLQAQKQADRVRQQARESAEQARESAEAMADWLEAKLKCLQIASRILAGDRVPPEDSRFLLENDPKLYQMAVTGRLPKEDPKEYDSLLDDEDREEPEPASDGGQRPDSRTDGAPDPEEPVQ